jgi:hypothetical protein
VTPVDGESPHLGGPVTCGSGQSTPADERRDGHGRCIVGAGAASSWTLSRKLSLYWLAGARLEAASCKQSGAEASGEAGGRQGLERIETNERGENGIRSTGQGSGCGGAFLIVMRSAGLGVLDGSDVVLPVRSTYAFSVCSNLL